MSESAPSPTPVPLSDCVVGTLEFRPQPGPLSVFMGSPMGRAHALYALTMDPGGALWCVPLEGMDDPLDWFQVSHAAPWLADGTAGEPTGLAGEEEGEGRSP